jgi:hypothetical protein
MTIHTCLMTYIYLVTYICLTKFSGVGFCPTKFKLYPTKIKSDRTNVLSSQIFICSPESPIFNSIFQNSGITNSTVSKRICNKFEILGMDPPRSSRGGANRTIVMVQVTTVDQLRNHQMEELRQQDSSLWSCLTISQSCYYLILSLLFLFCNCLSKFKMYLIRKLAAPLHPICQDPLHPPPPKLIPLRNITGSFFFSCFSSVAI